MLIGGSRDRSVILRGLTDVKSKSSDNNYGPIFDVEGVLRELHSTLSEELFLAMTILQAEEDRAAAAAVEVYMYGMVKSSWCFHLMPPIRTSDIFFGML